MPRMRAAVGFILVTATLDILSMTLVIPVLPPLVQNFTHGNAAAAAHAIGIFATAWALMQFIFSPVQGTLSDCFGRRLIILSSNFGVGLSYLLMAMAPGLSWLFAARIISGITAASFSSAAAYIADITPPDKRAGRFGLMSIAFGFGMVAGPSAGALLGTMGMRLPFLVAAGLSVANFIWGLFVLPESLPPERRARWSWQRASPIGSLRLLRSQPGLSGLATVGFLNLVAQNALPTITVLYAINRYGFTLKDLAWLLGAMGVSSALVGGVLTARVVRLVGERAALLTGLGFGLAGFATMGLAQTGTQFLLCIPILALRGLADPALSALMSRRVLATEQGQLQGTMSSLLGIGGLIGPTLYTESYAWFAVPRGGFTVPGAPFLLAAALVGGALLTASRVTGRGREQAGAGAGAGAAD